MGDEEEGRGKKEVLMVEGMDINTANQPDLIRHVNKMLEDLVMERAERTRAQVEADIMRTAWELTERDLKEAYCRLRKLRLELGDLDQETQKPAFILLPDTLCRKDHLEEKVKQMMDALPKGFDKRMAIGELDSWKELGEAAGKEVVRAVDEHMALAEEHLQRLSNCEKWVRVRERFLRTFFQVERIQVAAEKDRLVHSLKLTHEANFAKIQDFFKKIISNDLFLMISLRERIAVLRNLRDQKKQDLAEAQKGLLGLKKNMRTVLNQIEKGYRKAKIYESNKNLLDKYDILIPQKEKEIDELCEKKRALMARLETAEAYRTKYLEIMKLMKTERVNMLARFKETDIFSGFDKYFDELMCMLQACEKLESKDPGSLRVLKENLSAEKKMVENLERLVKREVAASGELISAAEETFRKVGLQAKSRFKGAPVDLTNK